MLQERLRQLEVALNQILELADAPTETTAEIALVKIATLAAAALAL